MRALADELFLVGWDTTSTGRPRLHVQGVELGLAGALIGELVLAGRVGVRGSTVRLVDPRPVQEVVADRVLADMGSMPQHTDLRTWLVYLSQRAVDDVSGRMILAGFLEREAPKLWRRKPGRFFATDFGPAAWPRTRLHMALTRWQPLDPHDMALASLVEACGMTDVVVEDPAERKTARRHLTTVLAALPPQLTDLARHVHAAVGDAVLTYRT
ncbi:GPP34 family phosphoprotein [Nonomuraea sp. NPDC059023]|uniref:GOLPH3/VPS74 family protein n=1 Tax=unclassified Nonomuraea TaxID=2593643 RepID=UPI0036CA11A1